MSVIGVIHFLHNPLLILYPVLIRNPIFDLLYIKYFFATMFSYTFFDGECPVSFLYKRIMDSNYIAGDRIDDYDEIYMVWPNRIFVQNYLATTTGLYGCSLLYTMYRINISPAFATGMGLFVLLYLSGIKEVYFSRQNIIFKISQNLLRFCFLFAFLFVEVYILDL